MAGMPERDALPTARPRACDRRSLLRGAGVCVALPLLESLGAAARATGVAEPVRPPGALRLVTVGAYLGFHTPALYPSVPPGASIPAGAKVHPEYPLSPSLEPLAAHRERFTLFAGLDHNGPNGHAFWHTYLTGPNPRSISLDQRAARAIGTGTRYRSLELSAGPPGAGSAMAITPEGIALPMEYRPSAVYARLFGTGADQARTDYLLSSHRSVLDFVRDDARRLANRVGAEDRAKLDEYFTALREVEGQLSAERSWLEVPKPTVEFTPGPEDFLGSEQLFEAAEVLYELTALALRTDSTRVVSLYLPGLAPVFTLDGRKLVSGYHSLSHHNHHPEKLRDLVAIDRRHLSQLARFLDRLATWTDAEGRALLDTTVVLCGTGMGDASRHSNQDVPALVAGGPFRHGRFVDLRSENGESPTDGPVLSNLFVSILRALGLEDERFANSSGDLDAHLT